MLKKWLNQLANHLYEGLVVLFTALLDQWAKYRYQPQEPAKAALLVIKVDEIGDYVLFRNYLQALKTNQQFQVDELHLLGNQAWRSLAEHFDDKVVDRFIWISPKQFLQKPAYRMATARKIRSCTYAQVIYPTYSRGFFIGDQLVKLAVGEKKIGFLNYHHSMRRWHEQISNTYYTQLVDTGFEQLYFEFNRLRAFFKETTADSASLPAKPSLLIEEEAGELESYRPLVAVAPGAGSSKREWPLANFCATIDDLKRFKRDISIVVIGGPADKAKGTYLQSNLASTAVLNYAGKTSLAKVPYVLKQADVVIANETSIPHIAAAVGTPCICPSNGNHYKRFHPYPADLKTRNWYIYPPHFHPSNPIFYYYQSSDYAIQSVRIVDVTKHLKEVLTANEI